MHHRIITALVLAAAVGSTACAEDGVSPESQQQFEGPEMAVVQAGDRASGLTLLGTSIDGINASLAERGAGYAVAKAEFVLAANASGPIVETANHEIFANNRQLRLTSRWVPGDERRAADGDKITYMSYTPFMAASNLGPASGAATDAAITSSFDTWDAMSCTDLDLVRREDTGVFPSMIFIGGDPFVADIVTLGFLPGLYFDLVLGAGASSNVLGVTFTYVFGSNTPAGFVPSDVDGDGRNDTALKEVWYNDAFGWATDAADAVGNVYDVETVALHENGHALELGHFGIIHATWNNGNDNFGRLHVSPRAVMNAAIVSTLRRPLGTDNASYCSNFSNWP